MTRATQLKTVGEQIREIEDTVLEARVRPPVDERLAALSARRHINSSASIRSKRWIAMSVAAAACFVIVAFKFITRNESALAFDVGDRHGAVGEWVAAEQSPVPVVFTDGTKLQLSKSSGMRVVSVAKTGARVILERGVVRADVVPRPGNDWNVNAGPFGIHVTGTSFDASWDPKTEELKVTMYEGKVLVSGPCIDAGRPLAAPAEAVFSCNSVKQPVAPELPIASEKSPSSLNVVDDGVNVRDAGAPVVDAVPTTKAPAAIVKSVAHDGEGIRNSEAHESPVTPDAGHVVNWQELYAQGKFSEAMASADQLGFSTLLRKSDQAQILQLADAARLSGNSMRATEAYLVTRDRFAGTDEASVAAFHLGRGYAERGSTGEARRWLRTYVSERPKGAFAQEAMGRLVEAEVKLGLPEAQGDARTYLLSYPTGPHARFAQSVLAP